MEEMKSLYEIRDFITNRIDTIACVGCRLNREQQKRIAELQLVRTEVMKHIEKSEKKYPETGKDNEEKKKEKPPKKPKEK